MFTIYVSVHNTQSPFTAQICGEKGRIIHGERRVYTIFPTFSFTKKSEIKVNLLN